MKTITLLIAFIGLTIHSYAQNCDYAVLDTVKNRIETRELVVNKGEHALLFRLSNFSNFKTFKINFFIKRNIGCFGYGDKLTMKLADGSEVQMTNVGHEDCGDHVQGLVQYATAFFLTDEIIKKVMSSGLKKVTLSSGEGSFDFEIKEEYADYFKKYINCIK